MNSNALNSAVIAFAAIAFTCGCESGRLAYRYGDGEPYGGLDGVDVRQRFCIRSISFEGETPAQSYFAKFQEPLPDVHAVAAVEPKLFSSGDRMVEIPIDVTVRFGEIKSGSGFWNSTLAFFTAFIVPIEIFCERTSFIEIRSADGERIAPDASFTRFDDNRTSLILPFGLIPYSPKEGCQENVFGENAIRGYGQEGTNAFVRTLSHCIAQQLKKHALERITMPEVNFDGEIK